MSQPQRRRAGDLAPCPELWAALDGDRGLREILQRFYARAFEDPRLAPFFTHTNQAWVVGKQHSFLKEKFTGEKAYFGDRPRNAHHWMVISDELFDYREDMLAECMREWGLAEPMVQRWREYHEAFRKQIVKARPVALKRRGQALPLEGFDTLELSVGAICDGCGEVLEVGQQVRYHVRTGKAYGACCAVTGT